MTAKRFKRYLFDGGFSFGDEYVPPKWSISDENTKGSPFGFLEFDDEHKDLCDEIVDSLNEFVEEYNHLKEENQDNKAMIEFLSTENTQMRNELKTRTQIQHQLKEENEQLKEQNADWETAFDNCKHYKEAYGTEIVKIKQTIKDMMENERTELGKMTLRQLWRQI